MNLRACVITDIHFGRDTEFAGQLRKMSSHAPEILDRTLARIAEKRPDVLIHLGDAIEEELSPVDLIRYSEVLARLGSLGVPVYHLAGNHDSWALSDAELLRLWGQHGETPAPDSLYRARIIGGVQCVFLRTHEVRDESVYIDDEQLSWLGTRLTGGLPTLIFMHHAAGDQNLTGNRWFSRATHLCLLRNRKRLRQIISEGRGVIAVINGHLHWNHLSLHDGIPYLTVQSLVENVEESSPGRPAEAFLTLKVKNGRAHFELSGAEGFRLQREV